MEVIRRLKIVICLWGSQGKESSTYLKMYLFIFYQKDQHLIRPACCLLAVETAFQTGQNLQGTFCREMAPEMPAQVRESPGNVPSGSHTVD